MKIKNSTIICFANIATLLIMNAYAFADQKQREWEDSGTGIVFAWVPGGSYEMGCGVWMSDCEEDEKPSHLVQVKGFWISKYEITQSQWLLVMGYNPSRFQSGGNYPVEMVSWYDVNEFINKMNRNNTHSFRLPTEAEWEYAARSGGKPEKFSGGDTPYDVAWYLDNSRIGTHPVGTKAPNGLGLYDMTGNVWEWVEDTISMYSAVPQTTPVVKEKNSKHVFRGGSWSYAESEIRTTARGEYFPDGRSGNLGFRLVRD